MTFGSNLARLQREIDDLKIRNAKQAETITALRQQLQERGRIIKKQDGEKQKLEAALDRKVAECLRWQQQARPLLTEAEDEAGTSAMVELERRGDVW
jgi:uncharacterized coiled-coil protein SlyX